MSELSSNVASASGYTSNVLRYGLVDIEPFEVSKIIKKSGLKFRVVERGFRPLTSSRNYEELVTNKYYNIFQTIEVPENFDVDILVKMVSQSSVEAYEKDEEIKRAVEEVRKARRIGKPLLEFIRLFKNRYESEFDQNLKMYANRYLKSNFPLSFFSKLAAFDNLVIDFLRIMEGIIRNYEFRASTARNFQVYKRIIREMQRKLVPIIDELDLCDLAYSRLKWYIKLWNSKDYEEIFNPEFLDRNKIDLSEFNDLYRMYDEQIKSSRRMLWQYYKQPIVGMFYKKEMMIKGAARNVFANLLVFPSLEI